MAQNILIYYFSGTGNSLYAAKTLASLLPGSRIVNIAGEMLREFPVIEAEKLVFVFPSYAYGLPAMVSGFVRKAEIRAPYIAALVTCGTSPGGTLPEMSRLLKGRGLTLSAGFTVPTVENFIPIFGPQGERKIRMRLASESEAVSLAGESIRRGGIRRIRPVPHISTAVSRLFLMARNLLNSFYKVSDDCDGCGICAAVCPAQCIVVAGREKPVFSSGCEVCQACLNWCPRKAITFGRLQKNTPRYIHRDISLGEMRITRESVTPR
ncbi:EFR1 family ferrodoxin [Breznakiella homolactica]|uniref:EFR1 family ferrodoxin n=1 Tax=Breznakiella homolactica TaxID=2798577 RepID=A0A7T7XLM8_9SPIR|nr:EFR1 family ferrodoxin [Breznakiella homolactica]QQO08684.1 EFR1 family ferrodoxin [Breznakiella homolactica]